MTGHSEQLLDLIAAKLVERPDAMVLIDAHAGRFEDRSSIHAEIVKTRLQEQEVASIRLTLWCAGRPRPSGPFVVVPVD